MLTVTDANGCTATATASFVVETQINQELCDGQTIDAEAETGATSYQWYKDGVAIDAADGGDQQTYSITEAGEYNYTIDGAVLDGTCTNQMCCPIIVVAGNCPPDCPTNRCMQVTVTKNE